MLKLLEEPKLTLLAGPEFLNFLISFVLFVKCIQGLDFGFDVHNSLRKLLVFGIEPFSFLFLFVVVQASDQLLIRVLVPSTSRQELTPFFLLFLRKISQTKLTR